VYVGHGVPPVSDGVAALLAVLESKIAALQIRTESIFQK
jgi:hypothetical protein